MILTCLPKPRKPLWPFTLNVDCDQALGLVGWWPGGPNGGQKLFDMSGRGNHGTLTNFASPYTATSGWVAGKDGGKGALAFSTANNTNRTEVSAASGLPIAFNNVFTNVFWHNTVANVSLSQYFGFGVQLPDSGGGKNSRYCLNYLNDYYFWGANDDWDTGIAFDADSKWHCIAFVYDGNSGISLYRDGVLRASTTLGSQLSSAQTYITLGSAHSAGASSPNARLEDCRIYNRVLSSSEVAAIYNPPTRWQLRYVPGRVKYFFGATTAIAFDAASNSGYQAASSSYSWSHVCTGSNRFLGVDVSLLSVPGTTVTGITYNGVAMSLIGVKSTVSGAGRVECWGLANPASGSNTIAVTLSAVCISAGTAASYTNVHQTSPTEAFNSAQATNVGAADATVTITTVADNDWIHAVVATDDTAITASQTSRNNVTGADGSGANEDTGPKTPAGGQAMAYTDVGALATWAIGGYAIRPVTAPSLSAGRSIFLGGILRSAIISGGGMVV